MRSPSSSLCLALLIGACGPTPSGDDSDGGSSTVAATNTPATSADPTSTADPTTGACDDCTEPPTVTTGAPAPACGDGNLDPDEACDDGNLDPGDGCEPDCTVPTGGLEQLFPGVMPRAVAVAPAGWIAVGGSQVSPTIEPWLARLTDTTEEVWTLVPDEPAIGVSVQALAVGADGVLHAAGGDTYDDISGDAWVARVDEFAAPIDAASWVLGDYTRAQGVALGPSASWYVGGEAGTSSAWVRRLDAAGNVQWTWQQPDAAGFTLAVDAAGNTFIAGVGALGNGNGDGAVWKIDPSGQLLWKRPQPTVWLHVAADPSGDVHVAGSADDGETLRLWVAKLSPEGDELWRTELDAIAGASASDSAGGLALSPTGMLYFATQAQSQSSISSLLYALDAAGGAFMWAVVDTAWRWEDLAVLPSGAPVVAGWGDQGGLPTGIVRVIAVP
ncbi:hypothetical protein [Nannocystis radixulma]|uniref:Myxococcus cysteine-rich repeat-containing protein n=1 Tax=Nannocystis radixulma TaxID=2995305 RepID=A0ABT5BK11_9BACT|nr:hypothetical protein [Nannocystis radixulma]MDC0674492.1 hypothetical protein [Nannocystis radixulma]